MGYHCIETKEWDGDNNDKESEYIRSYKEIHQVIIHVLLKACKRLRVYLLNNTTTIDRNSPYFYFNYLFIESGKEDLDKIHDEPALTRSITSWLEGEAKCTTAGATVEDTTDTNSTLI